MGLSFVGSIVINRPIMIIIVSSVHHICYLSNGGGCTCPAGKRDGTASHRRKTLLQTPSLWPPLRLGVKFLHFFFYHFFYQFPNWLGWLVGSTSGRTHLRKLLPAEEECESNPFLLLRNLWNPHPPHVPMYKLNYWWTQVLCSSFGQNSVSDRFTISK